MHDTVSNDNCKHDRPQATGYCPATIISDGDVHQLELEVTYEYQLKVVLNSQELVTLICTPANLEYLAVGFLYSGGFITCSENIKNISIDYEHGIARVEATTDRTAFGPQVITTGGGRGVASCGGNSPSEPEAIISDTKLLVSDVMALTEAFQNISPIYRTTHGVHSAAICSRNQIVVWAEDLGRHNAIDKALGKCLLEGIPTEGRYIFSSGRIASDMVNKAIKAKVPIILSVAVPTGSAIELARQKGITLICSVKNGRMNVFTHQERIA